MNPDQIEREFLYKITAGGSLGGPINWKGILS